ncbi:MAG: flagellar hook-basal body complex protein FliE [Roseitalea sp.]|jgi:flagellar hook-basal body complex protein FliE|nr:flagellar hook-basal body complex protein FliE [Roseitalea sp.]MBO6741364.1 flagellar hook-basal body complex protein FliE [Roseitalea sp.]
MIEQLQSLAGSGTGSLRADLARQASGAETFQIGGAGSFGDILRDQIAATVNSVKTADSAAVAGLNGQMDTRAVTDAVMEAERSLQAAVAIRDKIVTAYLDMTRMAI